MSKAVRAKQTKDEKKNSEIKVRETSGAENGMNGGPNNPNPAKCWEFQIVSVTNDIKQVEIGDDVKGLLSAGRIGVSYKKGVLGFVPEDIANEIIEAHQNGDGKLLTGNVIAMNNEDFIIVRLCLR